MPIVDIRERPRRRLGASTSGPDLALTHDREWLVKVDDPATAESDILSALLLPSYGDPSYLDPTLVVVNFNLEPHGTGNFVWLYTATFSRAPIDERTLEKVNVPDPLDRTPHITIQFAPYERVINKDKNDRAFTNSAGERYRDPITVPDERIRIVVQKNFIVWPAFMFDYRRSTNEAPVLIRDREFGARTLRFVPGDIPDFQKENGVTFLPCQFVLEEREETWDIENLDAGFHQKIGGRLVPIEIAGVKPSDPQLLNGAGRLLPLGAEEKYRKQRYLQQLDYTLLPGVFPVP